MGGYSDRSVQSERLPLERHRANFLKSRKMVQSTGIAAFTFLLLGCAQYQSNPRSDDIEKRINISEKRIADLENRVDRLQLSREKEIRKLQIDVDRKLDNLRRSQRFFISELDKLKQDIQSVTSENENILGKIRNNSLADKQLQKKLGDLMISIDELTDFFNTNINISPISKAGLGKSNEPSVIFETAYKLYKAKQLTESQKLFQKYRRVAPNTDLTDDSIYFVAYIHFLERKYDEAISRFFELIRQFPKSNWFYDAKWWLAVSLERTEDIIAAIDIYHELETLKPDHPYHHRAKNRLAELEKQ